MMSRLTGKITRFADKQAFLILFHGCNLLKNSHPVTCRLPLLTCQNYFTSILSGIIEKQIDWGPSAEYRQFLKENYSSKRIAVSTFMDIFHINRPSAKSILLQHRVFHEIPKTKIIYNYQLLHKSGANAHLIQSNVSLLAQDSNVLGKKIEIVQNFIGDINLCIYFLYHSVIELNVFVKSRMLKIDDNSKKYIIDYYQEELQIEKKDIYRIVSKNLYCIIHHPKETIRKIKLLLDYKISVNQLINDDWPLFCKYEHMKNRLVQLSALGMLEPIEPYLLICSETAFIRKLKKIEKKHTKKRQIAEYLSNKSGYSEKMIKTKMIQLPERQLPTLLKLERKVEIILNEGYNYFDVVYCIYVISLPEDLITNRLLAMKEIAHKAPFLNVLLLSDEDFIIYLNKQKNMI